MSIEGLTIPLVLALVTLFGAVGTAWSVRGKVEELRLTLLAEISASRHNLRSEFAARVLPIEDDVDKLKLEVGEHRVDDQGWFRNHGERIARLEGMK